MGKNVQSDRDVGSGVSSTTNALHHKPTPRDVLGKLADRQRPSSLRVTESIKGAASPREIPLRLQALLKERPEFEARYQAARDIVRVFRRSAFYEVSQRCNLFCEGCYYFESEGYSPVREEQSASRWNAFFAAEARRGVSMAYFLGAEPALEQDRLRAASHHLSYGVLGTNGIVKIADDIRFRIQISIWAGNDEGETKLRGAPAYRKAFANYAGDPRANVLFTLSAWNLGTARTVAQMCRDHRIPLTFNHYSPTHRFLSKLRDGAANDGDYFRVSAGQDSPCFDDATLARARDVVEQLMDDYPETILYSRTLNRRATTPGQLYDVDPTTGIANRCGSRIIGTTSYYKADLSAYPAKCCTPDISCSECRMHSGLWSSSLLPDLQDVADAESLSHWLDLVQVLGQVFLYRNPRAAPQTRDISEVRAEPDQHRIASAINPAVGVPAGAP